MKDVYRVLAQKEADLARVRREIEGLQLVAYLDRTTNGLQHALATWICSKCHRHYSRAAAETVNWTCEHCAVPLFNPRGQQFEVKKTTKPAAPGKDHKLKSA
jgi:PHP family Zn ribbon phosphoesterase